ncbi:MAG TPA: hypothetical protein VGQ59_19830 [Cyclobacteriaceae bacterium]|nr:hypothetical protein [Cyclobacteriaceae bacterium]
MRWRILISLLLPLKLLFAQDEEVPKKVSFKGYLKEMPSLYNYGDSLLSQNLIHNRLNFAWYANKEITVVAEFRTRLYTGDFVKKVPGYASSIDANNDYFRLSANLISNENVILNTMADRLYVQWTKNNWEIKAGRQRINWGKNLVWNPNDWFNAYSFFDFDYEERPGSDALRVSYYTGALSSMEVAAKLAKDIDHFAGAGMWKINKWNYDFQFLAGIAQGDLALGSGWAGNIHSASFKGELTYFNKVAETQFNNAYQNMFLGAISIDYSFAKIFYVNGSVMYNSQGSYHPDLGFTIIGLRPMTVRNLSPYVWSSFIQVTGQISPLLNSGLSVIAYPGSSSFFINPSLTISAMQNFDIDLIGQFFYGNNQNGDFGSLIKAGYVRLKWSF